MRTDPAAPLSRRIFCVVYSAVQTEGKGDGERMVERRLGSTALIRGEW